MFAHPTNAGFSDIRVDPDDPTIVYASFAGSGNGRVYRLARTVPVPTSMVASDITANLPVGLVAQTIAVDRMAPYTIYVGTGRGVYRGVSPNGGAGWSWSGYNSGLPLANLADLGGAPHERRDACVDVRPQRL